MALHYYSPKAHDFLCKILVLPHPPSNRGWGAAAGGTPGYLTGVINMIGAAAQKQ